MFTMIRKNSVALRTLIMATGFFVALMVAVVL
jgi:hypothetical protein